MFEILVLVAAIGVFAAIREVLADQKRRKEANRKWEEF
jgi:hypothetical protein